MKKLVCLLGLCVCCMGRVEAQSDWEPVAIKDKFGDLTGDTAWIYRDVENNSTIGLYPCHIDSLKVTNFVDAKGKPNIRLYGEGINCSSIYRVTVTLASDKENSFWIIGNTFKDCRGCQIEYTKVQMKKVNKTVKELNEIYDKMLIALKNDERIHISFGDNKLVYKGKWDLSMLF